MLDGIEGDIMRSIAFFFALLFAIPSHATVEVTSITGASVYNIESSSVYIYGGLNNNDTLVSDNADGTYSTCDNTNTACNPRAIVNGSSLVIYFKSSSTGTATLVNSSSTAIQTQTYSTADTVSSFIVSWGTICGYTSNSELQDCTPGTTLATENGTATMSFGIDTDGTNTTVEDSINIVFEVSTLTDLASDNSEGIEDYYVFPGDEKIYIESISAYNNNFTQLNPAITAIQVYYLPGNYCSGGYNSITNNSTSTRIGIDADGFLAEEYISGLTNDQEYTLRIASVDTAGNIGLFSDPNGDNANCTQYTHSAVPQAVYGLLADGKNCFIATAAYGSVFDNKVQVFRNFRDRFLMPVEWGQRFIRFYYDNSPKYAQIIAQNKLLKTSTQAALFPLLIFSQLMLNVGPFFTILTILSFIGFIMLVRSHNRSHHAE